ncbi:SPOR domain-containing protein [Ancylomarina sp.]|uniref:SPOR domain-containing protein n=1 Tax=Ancylomarina sp. TaxID=1970196 RepID=UPI00356952D0
MNRACICLLILTMFFSYSTYSRNIGNEFEIVKIKQYETSISDGDILALDTLTQSNSLIRRHSQEKDSTGIRYTKKYNYNNFPFFNFRISKKKVYHKLSEFNSEQAKELFVLAKNDQFNSDSLSREVSLLYTKQSVYSGVDKDLFKRRVLDLQQRSSELKSNAAQKAKHSLVLEQTAGKAPVLILAATQEATTSEYKGRSKAIQNKETLKAKEKDAVIAKEVQKQAVEDDTEIELNPQVDEGGYLDYEYEYCYQVAVFDKRPTNDFYKGMGFIKEEIVDGGKSFRYLTGSYRTYAKANSFKKQIKTVFPAAFVVVYKNGIRTNLQDAIAVTDTVSASPKGSTSLQLASDFSGEVTYRVQIGVFAGEIPEKLNTTMERYQAFGSFYEKRSDGKIVCTIGRFKSLSEVASLKNKLQDEGYTDAFTVAYSGQKRVSLQASIKKTEVTDKPISKTKSEVKVEKEPLTEEDLVGDINFRVQIGVFANGVPEKVSSLMNKYKAFGTSVAKQGNGKTVCTIGHFDSITDAGTLKKKLYEEGFKDIFTVAYTGGKRISIQDAIRLVK